MVDRCRDNDHVDGVKEMSSIREVSAEPFMKLWRRSRLLCLFRIFVKSRNKQYIKRFSQFEA